MSARDDILAGLRAAVGIGDETPEQLLAAYRAEVLREAANALASLGPEDSLVSGPNAWNEAVTVLRRMADEAVS